MVQSINLQLPTATCWCVPGLKALRTSAPAVTEARLLSHRGMEAAYLEGMLRNLGFINGGKIGDACFT